MSEYYITETTPPTSLDPLNADATQNLPVARMIYRKISGLLSGRSTCELMFCIRSLLFFFFQGI